MTIAEIKFEKKRLTEFDCYCCNREEHWQPVVQFMKVRQQENHLHVFIPSYPSDAPESFVTRVVYLSFSHNNFYTPNIRTGEVASQMKLVETSLDNPDTAPNKVRDDINTYSGPNYPEYIALFYRLHIKNWKSNQCQVFIDSVGSNKFSAITGKKIRIFYWLDLTGCQLSSNILRNLLNKNKNQFEILKAACQGKEQIHFLRPLPFVQKSDLQTWFSYFCFYQSNYESYVASVFGEKNQLPMEKIESQLLPLYNKNNQYRQQ